MQGSERLIVTVRTIWEENWSIVYYDLFLTDSRLILLHKKSRRETAGVGAFVGFAVGGVIGSEIGRYLKIAADSSKKKNGESKDELPVDDILKADKKNCVIPYEEIKWFKLTKDPSKMIFRTAKKERTFFIMSERAEQLRNIIPEIDGLNEKMIK